MGSDSNYGRVHCPLSNREMHPPVARRFGGVEAGHGAGAVEVGQRAGDAEDAVVTAGRKLDLVGDLGQEALAVRIRRGRSLQDLAVGLGVEAEASLKELEREIARLRQAVADPTLDKLIPKEAASGNF